MEPEASQAAPAVLADLIAAGLVSHEMIGDPAKLGGEAACLRGLCALVSGSVYRVDAYHYAFRAGPEDLGGKLGAIGQKDWTKALEAALTAKLGRDAVWLNATDLLPESDAALGQPLMFLRAQEDAVTSTLESVAPGVQAVINARYAADCARITAGAEAGAALDARLSAIEAAQAEILERIGTRSVAEETLEHLSNTLINLVQRIDMQAELLQDHIAQEDRVSAQLGELAELATAPADFQETLGVTFAEFLARIERQSEQDRAALRVPQFS